MISTSFNSSNNIPKISKQKRTPAQQQYRDELAAELRTLKNL
jgi:hypothetical protein